MERKKRKALKELSQIKKCGHYFHSECIRQWIDVNRNCLIDRKLL